MSRSPPARSARASATPSAWRWPPASERGLLDPGDAGESLFDHQSTPSAPTATSRRASAAEASAIAGVQQLGNLTVIYDDNRISIEDDTDIALAEDVGARYEAYGWHVQTVDWTNDETEYLEDVPALYAALQAAREVTDQPSFIVLRHDHRLARARRAEHRQGPRLRARRGRGGGHQADPRLRPREDLRAADRRPRAHPRGARPRQAAQADVGRGLRRVGRQRTRPRRRCYDRMQTRALPEGWADDLPTFEADAKGVATRKASGKTINAIAPRCPSSGAARPTSRSRTTPPSRARRRSCRPTARPRCGRATPTAGRVLHFGIREHGMGAIMNGIAAHGGTRVFGGTFLTFSDYMRGACGWPRSWACRSPTCGPTTPSASARTAPRTSRSSTWPRCAPSRASTWSARRTPTRPSPAGRQILEHTDRPAGLVLSRQNLPVFPRGEDGFSDTCNVHRGGYVLQDTERPARRGPGRHRLRGAARRRGRDAAGRGRHQGPGGLHAVPRVVRRPGDLLPRDGDPADRQGAGLGRGRHRPGLARGGRRRRPHRVHRPLRRLGRLRAHLHRVRHHGPGRGRRGSRRLAHRGHRPPDPPTPAGGTHDRPTQGTLRRRSLDLARRPVPRAHRDRQPRRARRDQARRRCDDQPDHLRRGHRRRRALRRAGARARRRRRRRRQGRSST